MLIEIERLILKRCHWGITKTTPYGIYPSAGMGLEMSRPENAFLRAINSLPSAINHCLSVWVMALLCRFLQTVVIRHYGAKLAGSARRQSVLTEARRNARRCCDQQRSFPGKMMGYSPCLPWRRRNGTPMLAYDVLETSPATILSLPLTLIIRHRAY